LNNAQVDTPDLNTAPSDSIPSNNTWLDELDDLFDSINNTDILDNNNSHFSFDVSPTEMASLANKY
jgi:hypothetical protein